MSNIKPYSSYNPAVYAEFLGFSYGDSAYKGLRSLAVKLANAELTEENKIISARGHAQLGTDTWNNNRIREIIQLRTASLDILLCFGSNQAGTSGGIAAISAQWTSALVFNEVLTLSNFTTDAVLFQVQNLAYLFNGTNDAWWDGGTGNNWYAIGASAPTGAPSSYSTISGSLNTSSEYQVSWSWYDSVNGRRTNSSPTLTCTTGASGANAGLRVTLPTVTAPDGYDEKIVLVTNAFGIQLFEDQYISAATTSVDITQSDRVRASLYVYEGNYDPPPNDFDIAIYAGGKIYGGRTDDSNCRVNRSKISSQFGAMPQSFPPTHFTDCEANYSDRLVGFGYVGDQENPTIIVVKQKSFGKLVRLSDGIEVYQQLGDIGGYGQKSIFQLGTLCGVVTESDIILIDGNGFTRISGGEDGKAISDYIPTLSRINKNRVYAKNITKDKQIRISMITSGQTWNNHLLLGHYDYLGTRGFLKWTTREQGPNSTTYPGVQAACMLEVLDDQNRLRVLYGNSQGNGMLYEADIGTTDNGSPIWHEWVFRPENLGDFRNEKLFIDPIFKIRAGDSSTSISFLYRRNLNNANTLLAQKTLSGSGFIFGQGQFGITEFSNSPIFNVVVPCQVRANELAYVIRTTQQIQLLDFTMIGTP